MNHPLLEQAKVTIEQASKSKEFWEKVAVGVLGAVISKVIITFIERRRS